MREQLRFATPDFAKFSAEFNRQFATEPVFNTSGDRLEFASDHFAELRIQRLETGELKWADAICVDLNRGFVFYYDHDYWGDPLKHMDDPYAPYRGTISFSAGSARNEKVLFGTHYGSFHYDASGVLRTIKGGSLTHNEFEPNVPEIVLQRAEGGDWKLFRLSDIPLGEVIALHGNITQIDSGPLKNGQRFAVDEIVTTLTEDGGRMQFHQETLVGHKQKTIEVPSAIDIQKWRALFDARNASWINVLSCYPSSIQLQV